MVLEEKRMQTVGEVIGELRKEKAIDLEHAARLLHVPREALEALEADRYEYFSAKVYGSGILRKYAEHLQIADVERLAKEFSTEWDIRNFHAKRELTPLPENRGDSPWLTPARFGILVSLFLLLLLLGYIGIRLFVYLERPGLVIEEPAESEIRLSGRILPIRGTVRRESELTVNGREITIEESGNFFTAVELRTGVNKLQFAATNRAGNTTRRIIYVLVE